MGFLFDCTSYLASAETVRELLLPAGTTVLEKWLPAETVCVTLLPAESSRQEAESRGQSLQEAIFHVKEVSAGSKRSRTVSAEVKCDATVSAGSEN